MKRIAIIVGVGIIVVGSFALGMAVKTWSDGYKKKQDHLCFAADDALDDAVGELVVTFSWVMRLELGRTNSLNESLNLVLDDQIYHVGELLPMCPDDKGQRTATVVLGRIAEFRRDHPETSQWEYGREEVQRILDDALAKLPQALAGSKQKEQNK